MTWDARDTRQTVPASTPQTLPAPEPASAPMVPTLAVLLNDDDWLDDPLGLDTVPVQDRDLLRQYGLVPPEQWAMVRRMMTRGVAETS